MIPELGHFAAQAPHVLEQLLALHYLENLLAALFVLLADLPEQPGARFRRLHQFGVLLGNIKVRLGQRDWRIVDKGPEEGQSRYMERSCDRDASFGDRRASVAVPQPYQADRMKRDCVHAKTQGMARKSRSPRPEGLFVGRDPIFKCSMTSIGVA